MAGGKRSSIRVPPGKNLAYSRGKEAAKGYGYEESKIQDIDLHRNRHAVQNKRKKKS
ncbi:polymorphic toxin type 8 domain-containing protein [Chitinophaga sp. CF118]|uniref:polymorphic toxin type 8 domain-containing protein n=1 Tax=Chitinophaga sp. CF118 TaxID=1884367 RepID=UPI000B7D1523